MKRTFVQIVLAVALFASCKKSDSGTSTSRLSTASETKAQYDNTSFGVYKGVIVGSTGTIIFRINNGDNIVKGYLSFDDNKDTLTTTQTLIAGQPITNVNFTGRISSMTLNANANGYNAQITNIRINGHNNVTGYIEHELSTRQVFCYEGTLSGNRTGVFNCTRVGVVQTGQYDSIWLHGLAKILNDSLLYAGNGALVSDSSDLFRLYNGTNYSNICNIRGVFNGDNFSGTWSWPTLYGTGTFACKRTL